ncbi:MAG: undecaprenyl-diphosphate phosphatase, partial [Ignisphaera sp.]
MKWEVVALGVVQGLFEWLPVSSKSILMLLSTLLLGYTLQQSYSVAIALQGGTVAAAALYFHRYLMVFRYRGLFNFLVVATAITGAIAATLYLFINRYLIRELDLGGSALLIGDL